MNGKRYFGKVCVKHPELKGERVRSSRDCVECGRESFRQWRAANLEKARADDRARYAANSEKSKAKSRAYRAANPEKTREASRVWREANLEYARAASRVCASAWHAANPGKVSAQHALRRSRKAAATVPLTWFEKNQIQALYEIAKARTVQTGEQHHVHHDRPLARGGKHHPDNMLVITEALNLAMGARYDSTWDYIST